MNRWRVMGYDTFASESYYVGEYTSETEALAELERQRRLLAATQDEALRDDVWLVPPLATHTAQIYDENQEF